MSTMTIQYVLPQSWLRYDPLEIVPQLTEAKAAVMALTSMPFQRSWAEKLQEIELKREVAGTSRIEGAEFTEREFDEAVAVETPQGQMTRSQKQARAAMRTYRWISKLPTDRPISEDLVKEIHRNIVTDCDDDHCSPGVTRGSDQNVSFGRPRHRGANGGDECTTAFKRLIGAVNQEFRGHDPLVQALALHYHMGAIHPFHDGNGRSARALEALLLQRAGLKDALFISMSNFYYDEKDQYLKILSTVGTRGHDMTEFLKFGLQGLSLQCHRLLGEIRRHLSISLFRDVTGKMYGRLASTKKRALAARQVALLESLLDRGVPYNLAELYKNSHADYKDLKEMQRAFIRDLNQLITLGAIHLTWAHPDKRTQGDWSHILVNVRLAWATEITETEFYKQIDKMAPAKTRFLRVN
jgi:Fic family protein